MDISVFPRGPRLSGNGAEPFLFLVHVTMAEESELVKAATALPFRPAIMIE